MMGGRERMKVMLGTLLTLAAMAVVLVALVPTGRTVAAEETHRVKEKEYEVIKDKNIDYNDEEEVAPEDVEIVAGKIKITTKTFKTPEGWSFIAWMGPHPVDNPGFFVDIEIDPECLPPKVTAPTVTVPKDSASAIKVVVTELTWPPSAGQFPLKCEGNLKPPKGEGKAKKWHWSAKVSGISVSVSSLTRVPIYGTNPLGTNEKSVTVTLKPSPLPAGKQITVQISKTSGTGGATFDDGSTSKDITQTTTLKVRGTANSSVKDNMKIAAKYYAGNELASRTFTVSTWPYNLRNFSPSGGLGFGFIEPCIANGTGYQVRPGRWKYEASSEGRRR